MAELIISQDERGGILKEIDEGAIDLVFQAIQEDMYSYPIRSFVRETISNGLDSITEKHNSLSILNGANVADYYLQRQDGKLLKDSEFDPEYYNKEHLAEGLNIVEVTYQELEGRDVISVKDFGVGLGGSRLRGYFKIGYSSKRNMKSVMGKFGAGSKSGLATGVEFYTMTTRYNGYQTTFMIFKHDYESITPEHPEGKSEVWHVKDINGEIHDRVIHWEPTKEYNGVEVSLEVKKHNKQVFINSVKDQFQYFKNKVNLNILSLNGQSSHESLGQTPHYESENLIIPKYSTMSAPHILVDGISYGLISWDELELQHRVGKIAIKVKATEVDITQSREALKWTERTKEVILEAIARAEDEANDYVTSLITQEDESNYFELNNITGKLGKDSSDPTSEAFSRFLDIQRFSPKYNFKLLDNRVVEGKMGIELFTFIFYGHSMKRIEIVENNKKLSISSTPVSTPGSIRNSKIVYGDKKSLGAKLAKSIMNSLDCTSFIYIRRGVISKPNLHWGKELYSTDLVFESTSTLIKKHCNIFIDALEEDFGEDELDDDKTVSLNESMESLAQIRKRLGKVLYSEAIPTYYNGHGDYKSSFVKVEALISKLEKHFEESLPVVICTQEYKALGELLNYSQDQLGKKSYKMIYVAKDALHHFLPHGTFITDYFRKINPKTGELMIGEAVRDLNTLRHLMGVFKVHGINFQDDRYWLGQFKPSNIPEFVVTALNITGRVSTIEEVIQKGGNESMTSNIVDYLKLISDFQAVVLTGDPKLIAEAAQKMFSTTEVCAIDSYDHTAVEDLGAWLDMYKPVFPLLRDMDTTPSKETKNLVKQLINFLNTQENGNNDI